MTIYSNDSGIWKDSVPYIKNNGVWKESYTEQQVVGDGYLYSGSGDNTIHKIDPSTMTQVSVYTEHSGFLRALFI